MKPSLEKKRLRRKKYGSLVEEIPCWLCTAFTDRTGGRPRNAMIFLRTDCWSERILLRPVCWWCDSFPKSVHELEAERVSLAKGWREWAVQEVLLT